MTIRVGVKVGQRRERSGVCAVEDEWRKDGGHEVRHFIVRYLQQLEAGMPFPDVAARVGEVVANARSKGVSVEVFVDATGFGMPILELVKENVDGAAVTPVYFSHGDRRVVEREEIQLGKAYLVAQLQMLLQTGRLHLLRVPAAEVLAQELRDYEIRVEADANERYGAFRVGTQDELVTALGLALQKRWQMHSGSMYLDI